MVDRLDRKVAHLRLCNLHEGVAAIDVATSDSLLDCDRVNMYELERSQREVCREREERTRVFVAQVRARRMAVIEGMGRS